MSMSSFTILGLSSTSSFRTVFFVIVYSLNMTDINYVLSELILLSILADCYIDNISMRFDSIAVKSSHFILSELLSSRFSSILR